MRFRWLVAIAGVTAMVCPAHARTLASEAAKIEGAKRGRARPPSVIVKRPADRRASIARGEVDLQIVDETAVITLDVTLTSRAPDWHATSTYVMVPRGAKVLRMSVDLGYGAEVAELLPASEARSKFEASTQRQIDPALIAWDRRTPRHDRYELSVYPIARHVFATVRMTITMPAIDELIADVGGRRLDRRIQTPADGPWFEAEADAVDHLDEAPDGAPVDSELSLFAGPGAGVAVRLEGSTRMRTPVRITIGAPPLWQLPDVSPSEIRKHVKLHHARLRACYTRVAQRDNSLAGAVTLEFAIAVDGTVMSATANGTLSNPDVRDCLLSIVNNWRFRRGGGVVVVSYPLRFELAD